MSESFPTYEVVINLEEQYSLWKVGSPIPQGWRAVGMSGVKGDCLAHIKAVWKDMRPLSARTPSEAGPEQPPRTS